MSYLKMSSFNNYPLHELAKLHYTIFYNIIKSMNSCVAITLLISSNRSCRYFKSGTIAQKISLYFERIFTRLPASKQAKCIGSHELLSLEELIFQYSISGLVLFLREEMFELIMHVGTKTLYRGMLNVIKH